jgi:hypothetical protein
MGKGFIGPLSTIFATSYESTIVLKLKKKKREKEKSP